MNNIYELHRKMLDFKVILAYEGEFNEEITKSVLTMAERNLDSLGDEMSVKKKVFNVMVESLQNIVRHADSTGGKYREAVFLIGMEKNNYVIASGNYMFKKHMAALKFKIDEVNGLDREGLKKRFKEVIKNGKISSKGGAGLGLIDMARKSGNKLEFDFQDIDEDFAFFSFKTSITRKPKKTAPKKGDE